MNEQPRLFGPDGALVGILTPPHGAPRRPAAVLLLNSGLVHRVGPGRLYVRIARALAAAGYTVVRFDFSGIGDSPPRADNLPVEESCVLETRAVMDALAAEHGISRFYLAGLCSGAVAAFRTACRDPRVAGIVMMNVRGFTANADWRSHVETHEWMRDYRRKLLSPRAWWRALTGRSQYTRFLLVALYRFVNVFKRPERFSAVAQQLAAEMLALLERGVRVLLVNSAGDQSIDYLRELLGRRLAELERAGALEHHIIAGADHTFARGAHQDAVLQRIAAWLLDRDADPATGSPAPADAVGAGT